MANRHDWLSWDQYTSAHESNLRRFPHFIAVDDLSALELPTGVFWSGRLMCQGSIEIHVTKLQSVRERYGRKEVRTDSYSYHGLVRREHDRIEDVLRYDNAHPHPGHTDSHHKHTWVDGVETVTHVGAAGWPTLGDVIAEVEKWWAGSVGNE